MAHGRLYYVWLYLPDKVKLPFYIRNMKRREKICELILACLESGQARLYQAGMDKPDENVKKLHDEIPKQNLFTNVILKYHTTKKIDFLMGDEAMIQTFLNLFRGSEEVMITGDNTRMLVDTDKYRQVILEGRKKWFPCHNKST